MVIARNLSTVNCTLLGLYSMVVLKLSLANPLLSIESPTILMLLLLIVLFIIPPPLKPVRAGCQVEAIKSV